MGESKFRDALEQRHTFPGPYMFKIMGKPDDQFVERVVASVRQELQLPMDPEFQVKRTANGRHVSITVEPIVPSVDEVLSLYAVLGEIPGVVFLL
ncbi:MAG: DUF493 domain-containing protein [Planctomycetaceae bacterium]